MGQNHTLSHRWRKSSTCDQTFSRCSSTLSTSILTLAAATVRNTETEKLKTHEYTYMRQHGTHLKIEFVAKITSTRVAGHKTEFSNSFQQVPCQNGPRRTRILCMQRQPLSAFDESYAPGTCRCAGRTTRCWCQSEHLRYDSTAGTGSGRDVNSDSQLGFNHF